MANPTAVLQRVQLKELTPELPNALIVGIIIGKQRARNVPNSRYEETVQDRAVWNFTLRDSPLCYINVTYWGTNGFIFTLSDQFKIGDVVDVVRPQIEIRRINGSGEQFRPRVTSPYTLILQDSSNSEILKHEGNCDLYEKFLHFTTKPVAGALTLADVHNLKCKTEGVDIFGIVRLIGNIRTVTTREGIQQSVCEITIFDQTKSSLRVSIWESDIIARSRTWKVCHTILFMTDVRCEWSDFAQAMVAVLTSRTILTEDPLVIQTEHLRTYAMKLNPASIFEPSGAAVFDVSSIQNVMHIQLVLEKIKTIKGLPTASLEEQQFTVLLYAVITQLDLDGLSRTTTIKCSRCDAVVAPHLNQCDNAECSKQEYSNLVTMFDLRIVLTDHTGSLHNCQLKGQTAESVLNCTVSRFQEMSNQEKSCLKWNLLMERCTVRVHVSCVKWGTPIISILDCSLALPGEVSNRLPHY